MGRLNETSDRQGVAELLPGQTRMVDNGRITIIRSNRTYAHDLCDAYNAARSSATLDRGIEWFVTPAGELKIGQSDSFTCALTRKIEADAEQERKRWAWRNSNLSA
jgi:hypothetical protein